MPRFFLVMHSKRKSWKGSPQNIFVSQFLYHLPFTFFLALSLNCIAFLLDELPFIQNQLALKIKSEERVKDLEKEIVQVTTDL